MPPVPVERVAAAIAAGAEELFGHQRPDGAFTDHPPASVLGTAGAVTALHAADPAGAAELIRGGIAWLRTAQGADGGWGGVLGADSEVVPTAVAAAALRIVAGTGDAAADAAVAAGQRRLAEFGGVAAVTDRAVAVLCQQFQALAGFPEAPAPRRLPLELVLFDRVRRDRISFRTAPFIGIALLQGATMPTGAVRRATTKLARPTALRLLEAIHDHEGRTGAFSEDPWPAALVCLGLARSGEAPHLVEAIAGFLRRAVRPDGAWDAVTNLDLTKSAFALTGLIAAGYAADPRLAATRDLFHRTQQRNPFPVFDCPAGGWSFSGADGWPVTLESAEIVAGLAGLPGAADDPVLRRGVGWLTGRQDTRGSWSLWVRDTKLANDGPCPAITAQGVVALLDAGHTPDSPPVARATGWLRTAQRPDGSYENLWYRDFTSGTAMVLDALARAGLADDPVAVRARDRLLAAQRDDGSFGPGDDRPGSVEETGWAVHALLAAGLPADDDRISRGVGWLLDAQLPDGSWPATRLCVYIRHHMHYPNSVITRGLALRALAAHRAAATGAPSAHGTPTPGARA
ncbi:prenyltransferase/squalene oxidase repeat-containing protein [Polymorphospora rubra]|uniref:prenyltransferase/squalene oxidase repeat-containing protein n=1 Tax=Polymorphospora rubra TaxID=338584 RepID=UPI0033C2FE3E